MWDVEADETGNNALSCLRADDYVTAEFGDLGGEADVAVQLRLRVVAFGDAARDVGIAWVTARGDRNAWYGYAVNAQTGVLQAFYQGREQDFAWQVVEGGTVGQGIEVGRWYVLRFELRGSALSTYFDARPVITANDDRRQRGWYTLRCTPDTQAQFDDILVWSLP